MTLTQCGRYYHVMFAQMRIQLIRITSVRLSSGFRCVSLCSSKQPYVKIFLITKSLKGANRECSFGRFECTHFRMFIFIDISHDRLRDYIIQRLQSKCLSLEKCYRDQVNQHILRMTSLLITLDEKRNERCNERL